MADASERKAGKMPSAALPVIPGNGNPSPLWRRLFGNPADAPGLLIRHGHGQILSVHPDDSDGDGFSEDRDRIKDTSASPYRMICSLFINIIKADGSMDWRIGTGFLIGPQLVVTAAHNCYHPEKWVARDLMITPGRNGQDVAMARSQTVANNPDFCLPGWRDSFDWDNDVAILRVPHPFFPSGSGFFALSSTVAEGKSIEIAGYPDEIESAPHLHAGGIVPYSARDIVTSTMERRLFYPIDTSGGESGAPVIAVSPGSERPVAVGIHNLGIELFPRYPMTATHNSAVRFSQPILKWIDKFR